MAYDSWKTTPPPDDTEPENEDRCVCTDGEHGTDCDQFEPPIAPECECFRLFTHDPGCPSYMGASRGFLP
jgi:hypothetical protein